VNGNSQANRQIARAAGTVMVAFVISNLVGLVRQILISRQFGTGPELDAFYTASTYPDLVFALIAGGALASAFVPTYTGYLTRDEAPAGWRLASAVANLIVLVLTAISLLSAIFAPQIVHYILAPSYGPAQLALTASLMRILLIAPTVFGVSGIVMGVLNAHQHFLLPALASTMLWLGYIFGLIFLVPFMGIYGLAWGAVLGAFLHLAIQLPGLFRLPDRSYDLTLWLSDPSVREVFKLMGPRLIGIAAVQINFVVNVIIATGQPPGSLAAIKYGFAIMTMPQVVIAQSIAIAALPTFSAQVALGDLPGMRASLAASLRGMFLLALPATFGLILLRDPVVQALFQHGEFNARSTEMVAWALLWYTAGLLGHGLVEILSRGFYAMHNTRTPVLVSVGAMSLNVLFSFGFSALFTQLGWMPLGGLALANTVATALEGATLLILMRQRLQGIEGRALARGFALAAIATLGMTLVLLWWNGAAAFLGPWGVLLGGLLIGGLVYAGLALAFKIPEMWLLVNLARARLRPT
jgi:putative peptidoglycan lipid II flippase